MSQTQELLATMQQHDGVQNSEELSTPALHTRIAVCTVAASHSLNLGKWWSVVIACYWSYAGVWSNSIKLAVLAD